MSSPGFSAEVVRYGNKLTGYACWPARAKTPLQAVIVLQEAWGVDAHIQDVTERFARAGYYALAPDLYAQDDGERPAALSRPRLAALKTFAESLPPAGWSDAKVREDTIAKLPDPTARLEVSESFTELRGVLSQMEKLYVPKVLETAQWLRTENPLVKGAKVAAVGYCMGGSLSVRLAVVDPLLAASVIYYGSAPTAEQLATIQCPVAGFYGSKDVNLTSAVPRFAEAMQRAGKKFEYHVYEGAEHAFFNETRKSYDVKASRDVSTSRIDFCCDLTLRVDRPSLVRWTFCAAKWTREDGGGGGRKGWK